MIAILLTRIFPGHYELYEKNISFWFCSFFVVGCSEDIKTVDWWGNHLTEAKQKGCKCKSGDSRRTVKHVKQALFIQSQQWMLSASNSIKRLKCFHTILERPDGRFL